MSLLLSLHHENLAKYSLDGDGTTGPCHDVPEYGRNLMLTFFSKGVLLKIILIFTQSG
jgi:hypothetical protein